MTRLPLPWAASVMSAKRSARSITLLRELVDIGHLNLHSFTVRVEIVVLLPVTETPK
jgi:hypothetical protein